MLKLFLLFVLFSVIGISAGEPVEGTASIGGLSGFLFLPGSEVLDEGCLRIQGRLDYIDLKHSSDTYLLLPVGITWGCLDGFEIGGEIPFYLDDSSEEVEVLGDITAGCAWLYETARGGSAIVLRGQLRLPTGREGRDRGSELILGASTSTTFRLFRLQASASYVLAGGSDPFEGSLTDYMDFSIGGASYIAEDVQIVVAMDGNTCGDFGLSGSGIYYILDQLSLSGTLRAGLNEGESYRVSGGVAWTGAGF